MATISTDESDEWRKRDKRRIREGQWKIHEWRSKRLADYDVKVKFDDEALAVFEKTVFHLYKKDPTYIEFTENNKKGNAENRTVTRPGRFLKRYFGHILDGPDITMLVAEFNKDQEECMKVHFAKTADEIEFVYENGPRSCMGNGGTEFHTKIHPVRAYAYNDLAIAYLKRDDRITARCVSWPDKKLYGRIYGDCSRLQHALEGIKYEHSNGFPGAKLAKIPWEQDKNVCLCPYLDGANGILIKDDHLVITDSGGDYCAENINGLLEKSGFRCCCCEEYSDEDDMCGYNGDSYCRECYDENIYHCDSCEDAVHVNSSYTLQDANYCQSCYSDHSFCCGECDQDYHTDDMNGENINGDVICDNCANNMEESLCGDFLVNDTDDCKCDECNAAREEDKEGHELDRKQTKKQHKEVEKSLITTIESYLDDDK